MSTKNRTRRTTTRNIRFPNQMIEQINIALEQKGSGNFSAWVIEACRRRLTSEAFDKRTNRVSTDVADKHARYISEIAKSGEVEKVTNELGDNGAHRRRRYAIAKRKDCPDALFLCRENGGQQVMFFWHLHVLPQ
ncbi:uncharacterized protein YlcI [Caerostris extrusa]|uniref:Uncharacterized protein YlcI n=7 Tax=cellular organisms TaxID=131567 RepID=A0AAV4VKC1_CAEEX|nr:uncharacterized protein YlcI [Caerostris extrusa]